MKSLKLPTICMLFMVLFLCGNVGHVWAGVESIQQDGPDFYEAGGTVVISNSFVYTDTLLSLLWQPMLPEGWTIESVSGDGGPEYDPIFNEIVWTGALPASPITMEYTIRVPVSATGLQSIAAQVEYQFLGMTNPVSGVASPNPLILDCQAPIILSFKATPSLVSHGDSTTLTWSISGATSAVIDQGIGPVTPSSGSLQITPAATSTYTLTVVNSCDSVGKTIKIAVGNPAVSLLPLFSILLK